MPETACIYFKNFACALSIQITKIFLKLLLYQLLKSFCINILLTSLILPFPATQQKTLSEDTERSSPKIYNATLLNIFAQKAEGRIWNGSKSKYKTLDQQVVQWHPGKMPHSLSVKLPGTWDPHWDKCVWSYTSELLFLTMKQNLPESEDSLK